MIVARSVSLRYEDHGREIYACREIDLSVHPGEFLGILGPSGSGKSSLLYLLSGLKTPTEGVIEVDGANLHRRTEVERAQIRLQRFGFVFQSPYLLGYLSALENVLVARPEVDRRREATEMLDRLGLGEKAHRHPHELSGGERQRVCVARALLGSPEVVFADEPTASLDHTNGLAVVELLNAFRGAGSLVMVTHDRSMLNGADRIITISDGQIVGESRGPADS
ncbi:MAG TPA: ABC transporter ATP-binding protein [Fimbriimonadaceae bacterium]|nr:ABC transporter ATP-binding protein [Fimbriimonadaceae bacterium]HRJ33510.1 ABC transporter ATP-binding protein [Fimbriimonadaceae bacterium]